MAQPKNIWMESASLVVASLGPRTLTHIVALVVIIILLLSTILSPFKPGLTVKILNKTVEEVYIHYDEHKYILDESADFGDKVNRLRVETFKLQERCLQVHDGVVSWTDHRSWRHYMQETKDIWVKACQYQREITELKEALELAIVRVCRDELEAELGHHGQQGEEMTGGNGSSIV
ncbi:hypothetical protein EDD18DRAFT_1106941 [Armillaria luteobubalina]|uniref:Uncharacterized protein n=1 Tax=Armillaria luteobubalina TaxID=153913 RepID=A0AA39Q365_9AGAR|nr:hypothetical protein EDD18DRAFT_1106941 [Armillaria luteobubalina]